MLAQEKLIRLRNYGTKYEVVLTAPDGRKWLVGYTGRKSKGGLLERIRNVGQKIIDLSGMNAADGCDYKNHAFVFTTPNGKWIAAFSGQTQRDAIRAGELPFVGV